MSNSKALADIHCCDTLKRSICAVTHSEGGAIGF